MSDSLNPDFKISDQVNKVDYVKKKIEEVYQLTSFIKDDIKTVKDAFEKHVDMTDIEHILTKGVRDLTGKTQQNFYKEYEKFGAGLVIAVQITLRKMGYNTIDCNGIYGGEGGNTYQFVTQFQNDWNACNDTEKIKVDGWAGSETIGKMLLALDTPALLMPTSVVLKPKVEKKSPEKKEPEKKTVTPPNKPTVVPPNKPTVVPPNKPTVVPPNKPTVVPPNKPTVVPPNKPTVVVPNKPTAVPPNKPTVVPPNKPTVVPPNKPTVVVPNKPTVVPNKPTVVPISPYAPNKPTVVVPNKPTQGKEVVDTYGNTIHVVTKLTDIPFGKINGSEWKKQAYLYKNYMFYSNNSVINATKKKNYTWGEAVAQIQKEEAVQQKLTPKPVPKTTPVNKPEKILGPVKPGSPYAPTLTPEKPKPAAKTKPANKTEKILGPVKPGSAYAPTPTPETPKQTPKTNPVNKPEKILGPVKPGSPYAPTLTPEKPKQTPKTKPTNQPETIPGPVKPGSPYAPTLTPEKLKPAPKPKQTPKPANKTENILGPVKPGSPYAPTLTPEQPKIPTTPAEKQRLKEIADKEQKETNKANIEDKKKFDTMDRKGKREYLDGKLDNIASITGVYALYLFTDVDKSYDYDDIYASLSNIQTALSNLSAKTKKSLRDNAIGLLLGRQKWDSSDQGVLTLGRVQFDYNESAKEITSDIEKYVEDSVFEKQKQAPIEKKKQALYEKFKPIVAKTGVYSLAMWNNRDYDYDDVDTRLSAIEQALSRLPVATKKLLHDHRIQLILGPQGWFNKDDLFQSSEGISTDRIQFDYKESVDEMVVDITKMVKEYVTDKKAKK